MSLIDSSARPPLSQAEMNSEPAWDLIIRPKRHLLDVNLREVWEYRDLMLMFVRRDLVTLYKQTILGPIWYFVQPLMTMAMYVLVFSNIAKLSTDGIPPPLFYLSGIVLWNYFAECFNRTSVTFTGNVHLFGKVYFPRLIAPMAVVVSGLLKLMIQGSLLIAIYCYFSFSRGSLAANLWVLWTPYLVLLAALLSLGLGIAFSSLTSRYRDLTFVIEFGVQLLMYATPIVYPLSLVSDRIRNVLWWNPIVHLVETFRFGLLGEGMASLTGIAYATMVSVLVLIGSLILFNRTEQSFMDTV
jgi:lipopolysaccharide transport system permease protein